MDLNAFNHILGAAAEEFQATELQDTQYFMWSILKMNRMYSLPINSSPSLDDLGESASSRIAGFLKTMQKEMDEGREILALVTVYEWLKAGQPIGAEHVVKLVERLGIAADRQALILPVLHRAVQDIEVARRQTLVAIADWLGDINVYLRSEALKFGIPHEAILNIVMGSNFTKLQANGEPIKDENGKVQKGPNFVAPEEAIEALLFGANDLINELNARQVQMNNLNTVAGPTLYDPMAFVHVAQARVDGEHDEAETDEAEEVEDEYETEELPEDYTPSSSAAANGHANGGTLFGE